MREVMTPRVDVVALEVPVSLDDIARAVRRSGHSHFPVYDGDLDAMLGVLFVKDLFRLGSLDVARMVAASPYPGPGIPSGDSGTAGSAGAGLFGASLSGGGYGASTVDARAPIPELPRRLREPHLVPETRLVLEILAEMRLARRAFAVAVDEYGGVAGVLTLNDIVSELVGDLRDEFDRSSSPAIERVDRNRYLADGACGVDEIRSDLGMPVPDGDYVTIGGFVLDRMGRIPDEGDEIDFEGWSVRVQEMDRRRVAKVVVQAPAATIGRDAHGR